MTIVQAEAMVQLERLADDLHETSVSKGFYDGVDITQFREQAARLCLIHSEVTEIMESLRKSKGVEDTLDEFADVLIRLLDFYSALVEAGELPPYSLTEALLAKAEKNKGRPHMHGVKG
jgi:NTP pyrophosphatase (non-canonical NTP hydrolase)